MRYEHKTQSNLVNNVQPIKDDQQGDPLQTMTNSSQEAEIAPKKVG